MSVIPEGYRTRFLGVEDPTGLPPHSPEAEQGILGCILLDPSCIVDCIEVLRGQGMEFYDLRHRDLYYTLLELYDDNDPIDTISVYTRLRAWNKLDAVGGIAYVSGLPDVVPSAANVPYYLNIVREKYFIRNMIAACTDAVSRLTNLQGEVTPVLEQLETQVMRVAETRFGTETKTIRQYVQEAMADIQAAVERNGVMNGLTTGLIDLDAVLGGLTPQEMVVIAARPGMGKTSLAMNIAEKVAITDKLPVGIVSLEMSGMSLTQRMIASRARINLRSLRDGFMPERDMPRLLRASSEIAAAPLYIEERGGMSIFEIRARARRWSQRYAIKLLVIDYLQLANSMGGRRKFENRQQEVSDISMGAKNIAKELNIPVIILSQLNRDVERDKNRMPRLSDLRESGSIEQDADKVVFLYRPSGDEDEDDQRRWDSAAYEMTALVAKNRNGGKGPVPLTFIETITRFESVARISDSDVPQGRQQELVNE